MPAWFLIAATVLGGTVVLALVALVACMPYLRARPGEPRMADPNGKRDTYEYGGLFPDC